MDFLNNTDIVVTLGFLLFVGVLLYVKVPKLITGKLDERSDKIRDQLNEARALREEAQTRLSGIERRQKEVAGLAEEIVAAAKVDAEQAAEAAKADIAASVDRRLANASEQIAAAEQAAIKEIKDQAVAVAVAAAGDVINGAMKPGDRENLIGASIDEVGAKLH